MSACKCQSLVELSLFEDSSLQLCLRDYFKDVLGKRQCEKHDIGYWLSSDYDELRGQCKLWAPGLSNDLLTVRYEEGLT